jgi:hypothetical protein
MSTDSLAVELREAFALELAGYPKVKVSVLGIAKDRGTLEAVPGGGF